MSVLATNAITDASGGNTATINSYTPTESNMAGRNRIINGDMRIDQRNAGASFTPVGSTYYLDRWQFVASQASKLTGGQNQGSVTPPVGFTKYFGFTSSSAYSIVSGDYFLVRQPIEGFNIADLGWGTANAQTVTVSFRVYSSLTGTFGGALENNASNRSYPFSYTVNAANTWETKSVTIAGDTSGTWETGSSIGIFLAFSMGAGSSYSGAANAWSGNRYFSVTGATSVVGTSGATFYITGVQLEAGSVATPFERRQYGQELALCQRYYEHNYSQGVASGTSTTAGRKMIITGTATSNAIATSVEFAMDKRAAPTMQSYDADGNAGKITTYAANTVATQNITPSVSWGEISTRAARIGHAGSSIAGISFHYTASAEL